MLVLSESSLPVLVMVSSKSMPIGNRFHAKLVDINRKITEIAYFGRISIFDVPVRKNF